MTCPKVPNPKEVRGGTIVVDFDEANLLGLPSINSLQFAIMKSPETLAVYVGMPATFSHIITSPRPREMPSTFIISIGNLKLGGSSVEDYTPPKKLIPSYL